MDLQTSPNKVISSEERNKMILDAIDSLKVDKRKKGYVPHFVNIVNVVDPAYTVNLSIGV